MAQFTQSNGNRWGLKPGSKLSPKHIAILNWLVTHPDKPLVECANKFGVSQSWLSCIIHSDVFQAQLKLRQERIFNATTLNLRKKLEGAAHVGVEKLSQMIEDTSDPKFVADATDKILHRLGYAPRGPGNHGGSAGAGTTNIQQNVYMTDPAQLAQARELMDRARALRRTPVAVTEAASVPALPPAGESPGASLSPPLGPPKEAQPCPRKLEDDELE